MKKFYFIILSCCAVFAPIFSCGDSIETAQDFKPNEAPVVISKSITRYDGKNYDPYRLISNTAFYLTVDAYDPEGKTLTWEFSSDHGSFNEPETTDTGVRVLFITGKLTAADSVDIEMKIFDAKKKVSAETLHVGTGKLVPKITITPAQLSISSAGDGTIFLSADCDGEFQLLCDNTVTSPENIHVDSSKNVFAYSMGSSVPAVVEGPGALVTGRVKLPVSATGTYSNTSYNVWVIFCDLMGQETAALCTVTVN